MEGGGVALLLLAFAEALEVIVGLFCGLIDRARSVERKGTGQHPNYGCVRGERKVEEGTSSADSSFLSTLLNLQLQRAIPLRVLSLPLLRQFAHRFEKGLGVEIGFVGALLQSGSRRINIESGHWERMGINYRVPPRTATHNAVVTK